MSLSNPRSSSPVSRWFQIKGSTGEVGFWDKDEKQFVAVDPFKVIVLDVLNTISGYHESSQSGIYANELSSARGWTDERLIVRSKSGVLAEGSYTEIKDKVRALGGKFTNSVYVAFHEDGEWKLGNVKLSGAAVSAWMDFTKDIRLDRSPGVGISGWSKERKGATEYYAPEFASWPVPEADLNAAIALDRDLQDYLSNRAAKVEDPEPEPPREDPWAPKESLSSRAPF